MHLRSPVSIQPLARDASDAAAIRASFVDPLQFGVIFDRHYVFVFRYLAKRAGEQNAEDLAAQTFTTAFAARRRYRQQTATVRPWLLGIASNLLLDAQRREARALRAFTQLDPARGQDLDVDGVLSRIAAAAAAPTLLSALAALRADERETLFLHALAGFSNLEIAEALDVPAGTVGARLHRTRERLRLALTPESSEVRSRG